MTGKLKAKRPTDRDRADTAKLKRAGDPAHINPEEDLLLRRLMPEAHGEVIRRGLLAEAGRLGDDRVTQLIPAEAALLRSRGGAGTRNPVSGLLEYNTGSDRSDNSGPGGGGRGEPGGSASTSGVGDGTPGTADNSGRDSGNQNSWGGSLSMTPSIANMSLDQLSAIDKAIADDIDTNYNGMYGTGFTDRTDGWARPDTFGRLMQEIWNGSAYNAPGRYGMPNAIGPGIFGTVAANFGGPMMSGMMGLGAAMGRAQSPAQQAASMAHNQALGSQNSTGRDNAVQRLDALGSPVAGSGGPGGLLGDGTAVSAASTVAPGGGVTPPTVQPGQLMDTSGRGGSNTLTGLPQPVQNLLADYIWRGRQGRGLNW